MKHLKGFNEATKEPHTEEENNIFIDEMSQIIELNHDASPLNINELINKVKTLLTNYKVIYIEKWKMSDKTNLEKFVALVMNIGYSVCVSEKNRDKNSFRYDSFFESFNMIIHKSFNKVESFPLKWNGPDITHHSILATCHNIKQNFDSYEAEDVGDHDGGTEIQQIEFICGNIFRYGYAIKGEEYSIELNKTHKTIDELHSKRKSGQKLSDEDNEKLQKLLKDMWKTL
jgi:hypothetical protein